MGSQEFTSNGFAVIVLLYDENRSAAGWGGVESFYRRVCLSLVRVASDLVYLGNGCLLYPCGGVWTAPVEGCGPAPVEGCGPAPAEGCGPPLPCWTLQKRSHSWNTDRTILSSPSLLRLHTFYILNKSWNNGMKFNERVVYTKTWRATSEHGQTSIHNI
jgi:hypothetical protein